MNNSNIIINSNEHKKLTEIIHVSNLNSSQNMKKTEKINKQKLKKISLNSIKNRTTNLNALSLRNNNITEMHLLKYRPKRLIKLKEQGNCQIPFCNMGGLSLDFEKTFSSDDKRYKINSDLNQNILTNIPENERLMNSNNDTEFKSTFIFKFAKNTEEFNKLSTYSELIDDNNEKRIFEETFSKISKLIESQNKLYFNNIDNNTNTSTNNNISVVNNYDVSPLKTNFLNTNSKYQNRNKSNNDLINLFTYTSNNLNTYSNLNNTGMTSTNMSSSNNNKNMKKLIIFWSEFIVLINKLLSQIFKELSICKKENTNLKKKSYGDELKLNNKINELDDLKKYINRFDINMKINHQIQKAKEIKELKEEFKKKENEYMLLIYKLEEEIKNLTLLLEKNKSYYDQYKNISKEIDKNKRQCEILKIKFNKELQDNNIKILIEKDYQDELKININELKEEINEMKKEKEVSKKVKIELQAKIKKLEMIITEKEENILMLYQELEYYMRKFNEEKFNHLNIRNEFYILEKKLYKIEEEKQKEELRIREEQLKKSEDNECKNKEIDSLSPIHFRNDDNYGSPTPTNFTQNNNS